MAKYNGSGILLYADGVEIAAQKGFTLNANVNLFDITTKQSSGWAEHDKGVRSADVSFEALQSTTGLSAEGLYDLIIARTSLVVFILGLEKPILGKVDISNSTINAPTEEATGLTGAFKFKENLYVIGTNVLTDPDAGGETYDTLTVSGVKITSAIQASGNAQVTSNPFAVMTGEVYVLVVFSITSSYANPKVDIVEQTSGVSVADIIDPVTDPDLVAPPFSFKKFLVNTDCGARLKFYNTSQANWSTGDIYLFKS